MTNSKEDFLRKELIAFISKFKILNNDEIEGIADNMVVKFFKKGTILIKEGDICNICYFVLKGCLRQFLIIDGVDKTTEFYTEEQAAVFFTSATNQTKTNHNLTCLEDSILIVGEPGSEENMYLKYPKLEQLTRLMIEQSFGKTQDTLSHFISSSPQERYLNLLKTKPHLLQIAAQHQLASYIGITPESLSRIRKRILKGN